MLQYDVSNLQLFVSERFFERKTIQAQPDILDLIVNLIHIYILMRFDVGNCIIVHSNLI